MAPEIVEKKEFCGPPTDVYAAGVLLFTFFCGCFPFKGLNDKFSKVYSTVKTPSQVRIILFTRTQLD